VEAGIEADFSCPPALTKSMAAANTNPKPLSDFLNMQFPPK
jgi:hypothetical protein